MNISPISFSGLWISKGQKNGISKYEYRPFSDETTKQIKESVDKYQGKTKIYYEDDNDISGEKTKINVKVGEKLNISTADYNNTLPYGPRQTFYSEDSVQIF